MQRHAEGNLRCVQGIVSDIKSHGSSPGSGDQFGGLGSEVVSSLFREAQDNRDPEGVVKLAQTLTQGGIKLDRFQQVRARGGQACPSAGLPTEDGALCPAQACRRHGFSTLTVSN